MRPISYMLVVLVILLMAGATHASVWDLTADFGTQQNPNGEWSYGWSPTDWSVFNLFTSHTSNGWQGNIGGDGTPSMWLNTGSSTSYGVPPGWITIHPGPSTQPCIVRWTAPANVTGEAAIDGQFLPGDGGYMQVGIRKNGSFIWQAGDSGTFGLSTPIQAGDTVDFVVYGGYAYGNTPVAATISAQVPEPSGAAFLILGLVQAARMIRRRR